MFDSLKERFINAVGRLRSETTYQPTDKGVDIKDPPKGEIGVFDSMVYSGVDFVRYNPDILMSRFGNEVYQTMLTDDQVKAVTTFKANAVVSRGYFFDVDTENEQHKEMSDFFNHVIKTMKGSFSDNLIDVLSALENGFSVLEKVYMPLDWNDKTYFGISSIKKRPFDTFQGGFKVDKHGNILEILQSVGGAEVKIPENKVIHFVHQPNKDAQYGESDLRAAYRPWFSKDIVIKFQNIHLERHAAGFLYASVKGELPSGYKTSLQNLIKNVSAKMGAILPDNVTLEQFNPIRTDAYDKAIAQYDKAIAKSILVPNLLGLSEQGNVGSYSQSETQLKAFYWTLNIIANRLSETLNEQLFRDLARYNFGTEDYPPFTFEPISDDQKTELAKTWNELVKGGSVVRSDDDEAHVRNLLGFPEKPEDVEPVIEPGDIEIPDQEEWIIDQGDRADFVRKEFAAKPWLKRVNFQQIERSLEKNDIIFLNELNSIMGKVGISIDSQVVKIVGERSVGNLKPKEFETVKVPDSLISALRKVFRTNLQITLDVNYELARNELPRSFKVEIRPGMDRTQAERYLMSKAMSNASTISNDIFKHVQNTLANAIKFDKTLRETITALKEDTRLMQMIPEVDAAGRAVNVPAYLENVVRTNNSDAMNQARTALFGQPQFKGFVLSYEYSAILDSRVTDICEALHGRIMKDFASYTPPNHFQCRSILVTVTAIDDWNGKVDQAPRIQPHKGFA